ncbi:hypothetical protein ACE1AT_00315, partial [Pelatocladus sp. BLCC-F211]|uniref:hypothetical protein n=1 Tax=Pelatocladus sp. BLCC-F211 TaxID=3342752 RepID=UPI0035BB1F7F
VCRQVLTLATRYRIWETKTTKRRGTDATPSSQQQFRIPVHLWRGEVNSIVRSPDFQNLCYHHLSTS